MREDASIIPSSHLCSSEGETEGLLMPSRRVSAAAEDTLPSESVIHKAQQAFTGSAPNEDISSTVISALLLIAFVVLTSGVIYLGVTDFLQKGERDKFEKEEAANKNKSRSKTKIKARAGPRGFGQKLEEEDED